jgi:hypothetical protein
VGNRIPFSNSGSPRPHPLVDVISSHPIKATIANTIKKEASEPFSDASFPKTDTSASFSTKEVAIQRDFSIS